MTATKSLFDRVSQSAAERLAAGAINAEQDQEWVMGGDTQPPLIRQLIELGNGLNGQPVRGTDRDAIQQQLRDIIAAQRGRQDEH